MHRFRKRNTIFESWNANGVSAAVDEKSYAVDSPQFSVRKKEEFGRMHHCWQADHTQAAYRVGVRLESDYRIGQRRVTIGV
jgi:hypothetical protein